MNIITIDKIWLTDTAIWIRTEDGREACEKYDDYPRLKWATQEQRAKYETDRFGIHWKELDEDLSFEGFFLPKNTNHLYDMFINHPELNASAVARRLGMSQSLFAQYISGSKKPSKERYDKIMQTIHAIGHELA
ncbi:MAG: DUF2442 domain-containing protein, partial [Prevotella sp.]|nr:DUF2442 domain-containing protein [Prevotella sp.]